MAENAGKNTTVSVHPIPVKNDRLIYIDEIFGPTIEGEGPHIGQPTVYARTGSCDYSCTWCDSRHAVDVKYKNDWRSMAPQAIFEEIQERSAYKPLLVTLSGGNPALYSSLGELIALLHEAGYIVKLETQGSIVQPWFADLDILSLSPKPPSSAMPPLPRSANLQDATPFEILMWKKLKICIEGAKSAEIYLKVPIFDQEDYNFARKLGALYPYIPLYLQPVNPAPNNQHTIDVRSDMLSRLEWLVEKVTHDRWYSVRVLPQLHVLVWGNKRGV